MSPSGLSGSDAAALRAELGHPIIDTDGHVVEFRPVMEEYLAELAGARAVDRFRRGTPWYWSAPLRLLAHAAETDAVVQRMVWPRPDDFAAHGDEFAAAGIGTAEDFRGRFVRNFYFGCEASDRFGYLAFADHVLPLGAKLKCVLGTDLGHYNPTAMSQMLPEAHRAVDRGLMTEDDFRAMTFENPVELFATGNPDFFTGTAIESIWSEVVPIRSSMRPLSFRFPKEAENGARSP